jgi:glycine cleavage system aminomethyltransferase T
VQHKLVGIELESEPLDWKLSEFWPVYEGKRRVGHVTDAVFPPRLKNNIGYVWVPPELSKPGNALDVETP